MRALFDSRTLRGGNQGGLEDRDDKGKKTNKGRSPYISRYVPSKNYIIVGFRGMEKSPPGKGKTKRNRRR